MRLIVSSPLLRFLTERYPSFRQKNRTAIMNLG